MTDQEKEILRSALPGFRAAAIDSAESAAEADGIA